MKLTLSPSDRITGLTGRLSGRRAWSPRMTYGLVVPLTGVCLLLAGWYLFTGETPAQLLEPPPAGTPRIISLMPPRPGPELVDRSLLQPPPPANSEAAAPPAVPPPPAETAAPMTEAPAAPPPALPKVAAAAPPPPLSEPLIPPGGESLAPASYSQLPAREDLKPLAPSGPLPDLLRNSSSGPLPIVSGGQESRLVYARPFAGDKKLPHIAIVVVDLGISKDSTDAAITKLPPDVSLSFSPYSGNLENLMKRARAAGHEVLMDLPLQPPNYPLKDGGNMAVLAHQQASEAVSRLEQIMAKGGAYVGLAGTLRSPVAASEQWVPLLRTIRSHGLLFVGDGLVGVAENDVPASASITLEADETPFRESIDARLARLLATAQRDGSAIAYVSARPVTFERLLAWFNTFPQRGVELAPVSAVVRPPT